MSKAMTNMSLFAIALVINKSISLLMLPVLPHFFDARANGQTRATDHFWRSDNLVGQLYFARSTLSFCRRGERRTKKEPFLSTNFIHCRC